MINRSEIEKILKVNGVPPSSPDDRIRSVLLSARFDKDEVDTAIMVLREDGTSKEVRVDGLHKVFRTDETLQPKEISELLGIEVDASSFYRTEANPTTQQSIQYVIVWVLSVLFAVATILLFMYTNEVEPFLAS